MAKEKWQEDATEMISNILNFKEAIKNTQMDLDSEKERLTNLLKENHISQFTCNEGKVNFIKFDREGLIKDNVIETVDRVNKGQIKQIDMRDLTKDINVCFINVRGFI